MNMRVTNLAGGMLLVLASLVAPNTSQAHVDVIVGVAPPAPRVEVVPVPRVGYVWAPGYWRWNGHRHFWVAGYWVPARAGWHWVPSHWSPYSGHRYRYVPGYWAR
jgi:YXWGXW repeat-containing protein